MIKTFNLPDLGEGLDGARIQRVLADVGDEIAADSPLLEVETEKAAFEIPSIWSGILMNIFVRINQFVPIGEPLLSMIVRNDENLQPLANTWAALFNLRNLATDTLCARPTLGHLDFRQLKPLFDEFKGTIEGFDYSAHLPRLAEQDRAILEELLFRIWQPIVMIRHFSQADGAARHARILKDSEQSLPDHLRRLQELVQEIQGRGQGIHGTREPRPTGLIIHTEATRLLAKSLANAVSSHAMLEIHHIRPARSEWLVDLQKDIERVAFVLVLIPPRTNSSSRPVNPAIDLSILSSGLALAKTGQRDTLILRPAGHRILESGTQLSCIDYDAQNPLTTEALDSACLWIRRSILRNETNIR